MIRQGTPFFPWFGRSKVRRVMQFQSQLLKVLPVSSHATKDWKSRVKGILSEAADIVDIAFSYAFLPGEGNKHDMEMFWIGEPVSETQKTVETLLKQNLAEDSEYRDRRQFDTIHTIVNPGTSMPPITGRDINLRSRTFHLETPRESGIIGLGIFTRARLRTLDELVIDSTLTAIVNIISSVKALSAYTQDVERFATRDPLTNLYNQISFWDLLEYESNRSKRQEYKFSLLVIDLDNFKTINDTYGHEVGDSFLKDFSDILKRAIRSGDIAARYAGDQFATILPVCDEGQAYIVAKRIIDNCRNRSYCLENGASIKGTVSIGVAVFPDHAKEAKDLFLLADNMVTQAKSFGKDRISMPSEQDDVEVLKSMSEKHIMILDAIAHKRIVPYFQPIMNVKDQRIEAFEVLTRIVLPDRVISAAEFIETAESMGAIGKIDYQLFEQALAKARDTRYTGNLFFNLSPKALVLTDFMPTIRGMMRDYGLEPARLIFEITERDTVKNTKLIEKFIKELKQDGFRFAIDDFGSGYSSFQYIKTFSVDYLKVDGEFIRHLTGNSSVEKQIVTSIADLAGHLNIKTIAEYVETNEILNEVRLSGINYAQGHFIQKPSPDLF
jgi:diguanylate cyclase (GGDEF)-like protein